ncbi:hypothetical protein HMPREF9348_04637 [Escherichia coli MS 145-7]|nr:hypothetical protein HMPREF9348_04637 [Escherichia coli MS 145-7]
MRYGVWLIIGFYSCYVIRVYLSARIGILCCSVSARVLCARDFSHNHTT